MQRLTLPRWLARRALLALVLCVLVASPVTVTGAAPGGLPSHVAGEVAAPGGLVAAPGPAQATRVRLGELGIIAGAGYYLAIENGYFAEQGIEVEATRFTSGAEMIPSLATGQIDIGAGAISAGLLNAVARGLDLRIVSDHGHSAPGRPVGAFVVRRDLIDSGQVRTAADLRGRTIAIPSTAVSAMTDVRAYLAEGGLSLGDARILEMSFPDTLPALANRSIDATAPVEPFISFITQRDLGTVWRWDYDVFPGHQVGVITYAPTFAREQPELARRWLVAYVRGVRYFTDGFIRGDGAARERGVDVLTKWTVVRDRALYDVMTVTGLDTDGGVRVDSMRIDQEYFVGQGLQERPVDLDRVVDLQYSQYARQVLGPY
jgi:NitT/TauT family transport system substrate-binding protein